METNIIIGIQARSTSERFPKKHHEKIGSKRLLDHVIDACNSARDYVNKVKDAAICKVIVLTPTDDPIGQDFCETSEIFYGSEEDVLGRYVACVEEHAATHIVRITGDCPLIPPFVISKSILLGLQNSYDYISNVDHRCRSAADGFDAEFLSSRMLDWLDSYSIDREHVTTMAREHPPKWAKVGLLSHSVDLSALKLSVDTPVDLQRVREVFTDGRHKFRKAASLYPKHCIHRI